MQHSEVYLPVFLFINFNLHFDKKKNMIIVLFCTFMGSVECPILQIYVLRNNYQEINSTHCDFSICIHLDFFQLVFHNDSCKAIYYIDFSLHTIVQGYYQKETPFILFYCCLSSLQSLPLVVRIFLTFTN